MDDRFPELRTAVKRRLTALGDAARHLRRHESLSRVALDDLDTRWLVERGLALCAQHALDIAVTVAADFGRDPVDYGTAVDALAAEGVLPRDFVRLFRRVAALREMLVLGYLDVDVDVVHDVLTTRLDDFEVFAEHVSRWLATQR